MPLDAAFCPGCRALVRPAGRGEPELVPAAVAAKPDSAPVGTDVVEEAVRSSMATSGTRTWNLVDRTAAPADPERLSSQRTSTRAGRLRRPTTKGTRTARAEIDAKADQVSALARVVAVLVTLPGKARATSRSLGALPVAVLVVVLALLGSGGLLYSVGAFEHEEPATARERKVRLLEPAAHRATCAARPSVTAAGKKVTFGGANLVDGDIKTAWRCAGDGSNQRVTLSFTRPIKVTKVALVPGWATKDPTSKADRFAENGAPTAVTWRFAKTSQRQRVGTPEPSWSVATLDPRVRTRTVTLAIDSIRPGERRAMVAVSEIRVYGNW